MKKLLYLLLLITGFSNAQIVNIPDANFKARLLSSNLVNNVAKDVNGDNMIIDQNGDGEIQLSEAALVYQLNNLSYSSLFPIYDLTGIQSFSNLTSLFCGYSEISSLDVSNMTNLSILFCNNSNLTSINISGCVNLYQLVCENNQLTSLDVSGFTSLTSVYADNNQLQNINLNGATNLSTLSVGNNLLTSIDATPCPNLYSLYASVNSLNSINVSGLVNLNGLYLNYNQLTSIDLSSLTNLEYLQCSYNLLTTIDISNNHNFTSLACTDNPNLVAAYLKFGRPSLSISGYPMTNNPNLQYVCADDYRVSTFLNYFISNSMPSVVVNSYCSFTPGGNYNTITGSVTFDGDNNGCDATDLPHPNIRIDINDGINQGGTFTNNLGNYNFYTQAGSFSLTPNLENPSWFNVSPTTTTIPFANNNNNIVTQNFCIAANGVHPDLEIVIAPIVPARPGFDAVYQIVYKNKGNQTLSQLYGVNFFFNQNLMDFVSASILPSTVGSGALSWSYTNLLPFESRSIYVTLNINTPTDTNPVNIGDILQFTTSILPMAGDESTSDNTFLFNQTVVGSFDPNDITCMEGNVVSPSEIGEYLHYVVNFENTGTAEAENIVVKTEINTVDFDINSLQLLDTSHNCYTRVSGNIVEFIFQNIMLDTGGHGNVLLKIRSKSNLVTGDTVSKQANIFFDYNAPILTNMENTTFQALNNDEFEKDNLIAIYPNPTEGNININSNFNIKSIELYDVQGRLLQTKLINETISTINISDKSNGIYFLKITSDKGIKVEKIMKK
ncbi:T9SS type A sorting domain-containing protein [Flavobacterium sp.]|uniref:DUF7619 domain-containing protein n=1 Tax=Flavobacterium sp. TaxID=239 RepID=UPI002617972D|nr:T9SS type A sorting domain-containing protein [Flavobacterium sp.]